MSTLSISLALQYGVTLNQGPVGIIFYSNKNTFNFICHVRYQKENLRKLRNI